MKYKSLHLVFYFLCLVILSVACNAPPISKQSTPIVPVGTETPSPTPESTSTFIPTVTETPTPTKSPTPTIAPTVTQTPTPELPVALGTSLPQPLAIIHAGNVKGMAELARFGDGELLSVQVSADGNRLVAVYSTGLRLYNSQTLEQVGALDLILVPGTYKKYVISPNGTYLAILENAIVQLWRITDGTALYEFSLSNIWTYLVEAFAFSPDEASLVLSISVPYNPGFIYHWRVTDGVLLFEQEGWRQMSAFSQKSSLLAVGFPDGTIQLRQPSNGELLKLLTGPEGLSRLAFSRDGEVLAAGYEDSIWLWRISDGQVLQQLYGKAASDHDLFFSQDGQVLFSISTNLRLWRVIDGRQLINLVNEANPVLSPDRTRLITSNNANETILWDVGQQRQVLKVPGYGGAYFSSDSAVAVIEDAISTHLFRAVDGELIQTLVRESQALLLADGQTLVTAGAKGVLLRSVQDGVVIRNFSGYKAIPLPDERRLMTIDDGHVNLWDLATGELLHTVNGPTTRSLLPALQPFSADGRTLLLTSPTGLQLLDLASLAPLASITGLGEIFSISQDRTLLAHFTGKQVEIRQVQDQVLLTTFAEEQITRMLFSPDNQILATMDGGNKVTLWQVRDGKLLATLTAPNAQVGEFAFSPDSRLLFETAYGIGTTESLLVWQVPEGILLRTQSYLDYYEVDRRDRTCDSRPFALSPDSRFLAMGGANCDTSVIALSTWLLLQSLATGQETESLFYYYELMIRHHGVLAFTPDGSLLATAFEGGEINFWRVVDGSVVHTLIDHLSPVLDSPAVALAFSPDGRMLVTSGLGITRLWGIWP